MNVPEQLRDLVAHEPPYVLDPDAVLAGGRRRRRTRATRVAAALGGTAVVVAAVVALQPSAAPVRDSVTSPSYAAPAPEGGPLQQLVRRYADPSWTFAVHDETATSFDADVDDGSGAGRMGLWLSPPRGSIQQHPCQDAEFAEGAACVETQLDADTRLVVKGPGLTGPVTVIGVVLVHRDGSGVIAESDNATWPWPRDGVVTPEEKKALNTPAVNRPRPVWTVERLVELVRAADAATSGR